MKNISTNKNNKDSLFSLETLGMTLILFSAISIIFLLLSDVLFGEQWFYTQFWFGAFGYTSFIVLSLLLCWGANLLVAKKRRSKNKKLSVVISLIVVFTICLLHCIFNHDSTETFKAYVESCYNKGANGILSSTVGGAFFAAIVYFAVRYLSVIGAYLLFSLIIAIFFIVAIKLIINFEVDKLKSSDLAIRPDKISGIMEYPDESFDFGNSPDMQPVKNRLYYGNGSNNLATMGKKDKKSNNPSLNILYSDRSKSKDDGGMIVNSGSMSSFATKRTGDFSGRSYYNENNFNNNNNLNRVSASFEGRRDNYDFNTKNESSILERRTFSSERENPRAIYNHDEARGGGAFVFESSNQEIKDFSRETNRVIDLNNDKNVVSSPRELYSQQENIPQKENSNETESVNDNLTTAPFATDWVSSFKRGEVVKGDEPEKSDSKKQKEPKDGSNAVKFLAGEKKAIYIEPDTGEAVIPSDEMGGNEAEQVPLVEKLQYIGIPEMPIRYRYKNPPIELYNDNPKKIKSFDDIDNMRCGIIEKTLENFNVPAKVENVIKGPTITRFEISIPDGITVSKVPPRASDLAMRLEVEAVRIEAPIPGKNLIGIEVPNKIKDTVGMKELLLQKDFKNSSPDALSIVLGEDVVGNPVITDLTKTPHLLVAGATGMGKSVFLNALIMSLVTKYSPTDLRLVLVDPKQVEFNAYEKLPHLLIDQIITEASLCIAILDWAIDEMEQRYKILRSNYAQKIDEYNRSIDPKTQKKMPKIVIIIDELGDLFSISNQIKHDVEDRIKRLTQKARAAGIHLVVATQRPDVTVITGVIKTNLPSRVAFKVLNYQDSNTILNDGGADKLLGNGDMIFKTSNSALLKRIQGAFVSKDEMKRVLEYISDNNPTYYDYNAIKYLEAKKASTQNGGTSASISFGDSQTDNENDPSMFNNIPIRNLRALKAVILKKQASISLLQRMLSIGYSTAGRIIDWMENMNYISGFEGSKSREVLITMEEFNELYGEANLD